MPSLTAAFQSVMYALDWSGRNEVVLSEREWVSLQHVVQAHPSAKAVFVPAQHAPDSDAFLQYIGKRTRLVAFSHVCYQTGYRSDIARTTNHAHEQGASCFVDAYQSLGVTEVDAMALNVDFLAAGALKFLLGIPGAAFLYVQLNQHESLQPTLAGWRGQTNPMNPALNPAEGARRFMGGTWPVPSVYGARAGLDLLLCTSVASTALRVEQLATHLHSALSSLNLEVLTPQEPARRAGIISVRCPNPAATLAALRELGVVCSLRGEGLRFSLHAYNTHREIDKAMSRLQRILATPNSDARFSPPLSET
jgi:selenocysteine lyase/cysteine desulfurase